jgi:hypothetical protein
MKAVFEVGQQQNASRRDFAKKAHKDLPSDFGTLSATRKMAYQSPQR